MADPPRYPDTDDDTGVEPDHGPPGMPRWVKVSGIVIGVLVVLGIAVMMLGGGVEHGPGLHGSGANADADHGEDATPIAGAPELAVTAGDLRFEPDRIELPAGMLVNVALTATDILHDLVVDEINFHLAADRDETVVGGLMFPEPGTYVGYCSVPGHREAGMEFAFVVTASDADHTPPVEH